MIFQQQQQSATKKIEPSIERTYLVYTLCNGGTTVVEDVDDADVDKFSSDEIDNKLDSDANW